MAETNKTDECVKLFVGQVPKHMSESQLIAMFKEFALVDEVNIIKDKATRSSRGCCFVICPNREEADKAVEAFHNKRTLTGASSPLQVKYADGELERLEHKLFIGMLPKNVSEGEVSALFSQYGTLKDLQILRGSSQQTSKGCAFVKYETKDQAVAAIEGLNGKHKMAGSTVPLVVKWADNEKERQARKAQKAQSISSTLANVDPTQHPFLFGALPMGYMSPYNGYGYQAGGTYGLMPPYSLNQANALQRGSPRNFAVLPTGYMGSPYPAIPRLQYPPFAYPGRMRPLSGPSSPIPLEVANNHTATSSTAVGSAADHIEGMSQNADESDLKEDYPSQLRDSLRCQILLKLVLQLPRLTVIPRTVFEHMPLLEVLDLSSTSIQSLPSSVSSLSSLKELLLRDCSFLIELPIEIGMLTKLKLLDIEGSDVMYIPKEIVQLTDLEVLRLCLSQYAEYYIKAKNVNGGVKVPRMMISELKKLKEFCISVCQEAEWWEQEIKEIQDEICHLENLEFLKWYLPTDTTLKQFLDIQINRKPAYEKLSNFTFTIGQHAQLTSCLPRGLEKKFAEFEKCLKWINAEGNIYDISKIMTRAKALFLSRHWTIVNLSAFDISKLKYFLLAECNEMETLVKIDDLSEIVENNKKSGLESLEYLSIHYMEKLKSIWEGPIGKDSLSRLRILALHTCLELTTIFTPRIAQNLSCLAELTVEECPKVRSLIITPHSQHGPLFPNLERIFLIDLPELDHIFGGLIVLEKLEILMIYNCIKLRRLSEMELPRIQKIKGENKWWNSLNAYEPTWENFFEPLKEKSELIKQLLEATNSLQHFHDVVSREAKDEKPLDGPGLGAQETKIEPFNFPLRKEEGRFHTLPGTEGEFDVRTSFRIKGTEGELDVIYRRLGLSGAEDFAISTVDWENRRSYSPIVGRVGSLPVSIKDYDSQLSLDFERKADLKDKTEINNGARVLEDGDDVENDKTGKRGIKGAGLQYTISPNGTFKGSVKNWQKGDLLGSGSFGTVYEGFDESGFLFAVKEVSLPDQGSQGKQSIFQLQQEISLLSQFHHENIVRYLGTDTDDGKLYIFLELVTKGSLAKLYQKYHLGDSQVLAYTRQILSGLNYLHERKVVHRDIKCANILVDTSGSVKLADFGLANALNDIKSCKGTPYWVAPEVVDNRAKKGYGLAADIWSLGCTVLEMLTRKIPYYHLEGMQALFRISRGEPPEIPNTLSAAAQDFILKCLQVNPNDRPTAAQLLEHPFLRNQHL